MLLPILDRIKDSTFKYAPGVYLKSGLYKTVWNLKGNRIFNRLNYRSALKKIKERSGKPPGSLYIETTTLCKAKCAMCGLTVMKREKGSMNQQLFEKIIEDASRSGIRLICLNNLGETLMDERLFERIRLIKKYGLKVMFHTNGVLLDEEKARLILETGVDIVGVSIDAFSKETYERIRTGLSFEKVVKNTISLAERKRKEEVSLPLVKVNFVVQGENIHEVRSFYNFWRTKVDYINITFIHDWAGQLDANINTRAHNGLPNLNPCNTLWKEMIVLHDGRVSLCCNDYEGKVIMGDLRTQDIMDVWLGEKFQNYRKNHIEDKRASLPLCNSCSRYSFWF